MQLTAVLFDLDGTLLDRRATFRLHLEGQIRRHPGVFEPTSSDRYLERLLVLDEQGVLDRTEFYRAVQADLGLPRHASDLLREDFERRFPERCIPEPNAMECLDALRQRGMKGEPSSAAVYVGDNPEPDVGGAKTAGLCAVLSRDPFWAEPELADEIIDDLMELLPWIDVRSGV